MSDVPPDGGQPAQPAAQPQGGEQPQAPAQPPAQGGGQQPPAQPQQPPQDPARSAEQFDAEAERLEDTGDPGAAREAKRFRQEAQRMRESYDPIAKSIGALHPEDQQALMGLAQTLASGDTATATEWMLEQAQRFGGEGFSKAALQRLAQAQAQEGQQPAEEQKSPEKLAEEIVERKLAEREQTQRINTIGNKVRERLGVENLDNSADKAIALMALNGSGDVDEAINELAARIHTLTSEQPPPQPSPDGPQQATIPKGGDLTAGGQPQPTQAPQSRREAQANARAGALADLQRGNQPGPRGNVGT